MKIYITVPVSERLPEEEKTYPAIFFGGTEYEYIISVSFDIHYSFYSEVEDCTGITHWLEERELPSEEEIKRNAQLHQEMYDDDPHNIGFYAFEEGANLIINKITKP